MNPLHSNRKLALPVPCKAFAAKARAVLAAAVLLGLALPSADAGAFGFGEPIVSSALGQPLRLRIPVRLDPDMELSSPCVRLVSSAANDVIPTLTASTARVSIERKGEARFLRVDSFNPVNEPALRVTVEAGCAQHAQREFLLLLDPPNTAPMLAITAPLAAPAPPDAAGSGTEALRLGEAVISGHVGEPLTLQIPVLGTDAGRVNAGCVRLGGTWNGSGAPVLSQAQLGVSGTPPVIQLTTENSVTEPALRVVVSADCAGASAQREYAVLLDGPDLAPAAPAPAASDAVAVADATPPEPAAQKALEPPPASGTDVAAPAPVAQPPVRPRVNHPPRPSAVPATALPLAPSQTGPAIADAAKPPPPGTATTARKAPAPPSVAAERPKAATPAADHLVLTAPVDQPDPAALRIAEMDKRIAELTREVSQLRAELVAERQRQAEASAAPPVGVAWSVAIVSLLCLGVASLLLLARRRASAPWEKPGWDGAGVPSTVMAPAAKSAPAARDSEPEPDAQMPADLAAAPASAEERARSRRPRPTVTTPAPFEELTGASSTITPGAAGPQTQIEVTEMHADDPGLGKLHTIFLDPGMLDAPPVQTVQRTAADTRVPGPPPAAESAGMTSHLPGAVSASPALPPEAPTDAAKPATVLLPTAAALPPMPDALPYPELPPLAAPTVVAPVPPGPGYAFDDNAFTQTPTMLVLDLDLTTRALADADSDSTPVPGPERRRAPREPVSGAGERRGGYKNGH